MSEVKLTKAMVLAAGLSTRMRPLTENRSKATLDFLDRRMLDWTCLYLQEFGIESVACNLFHGKEEFLTQMDTKAYPLPIQTFEEKTLRGTGGGIAGMKDFVDTDHCLILNCDFLCDVDLDQMLAFHLKRQALVTMAMIPNQHPEKYGSVRLNGEGQIQKIGSFGQASDKDQHMFCGIHIVRKELFDHMPDQENFCIIQDVYAPLLEKGGKILGFESSAKWYDLGELDLYRENEKKLRVYPLPWMKAHMHSGQSELTEEI